MVEHGSSGYRGLNGNEWSEFVEAVADTTAENDQIRRRDALDHFKVLVETAAKCFPTHLILLAGGVGHIVFCYHAVQVGVAEFRISDEVPVGKQG